MEFCINILSIKLSNCRVHLASGKSVYCGNIPISPRHNFIVNTLLIVLLNFTRKEAEIILSVLGKNALYKWNEMNRALDHLCAHIG